MKIKLILLTKITFILVVLGIISGFAMNQIVISSTNKYIIDPNSKIPEADAIIILGAFVKPSGKLSDILKDRLDRGYEIYQKNTNLKVLVSGDHGQNEYDEVNSMKKYLEEKGIPGEKIFMDHAGFSTYETAYRGNYIFEIKKAIVVTQKFHLNRSVYNCRQSNIEAYGVNSDYHRYIGADKLAFREFFARIKDFIYCMIDKKPKYLGTKIPIKTSNGDKTKG